MTVAAGCASRAIAGPAIHDARLPRRDPDPARPRRRAPSYGMVALATQSGPRRNVNRILSARMSTASTCTSSTARITRPSAVMTIVTSQRARSSCSHAGSRRSTTWDCWPARTTTRRSNGREGRAINRHDYNCSPNSTSRLNGRSSGASSSSSGCGRPTRRSLAPSRWREGVRRRFTWPGPLGAVELDVDLAEGAIDIRAEPGAPDGAWRALRGPGGSPQRPSSQGGPRQGTASWRCRGTGPVAPGPSRRHGLARGREAGTPSMATSVADGNVARTWSK